jgi:hypothetical protein
MSDERRPDTERAKVQTTLYLDASLFDRYQTVYAKLRSKRREAGEKGRLRVHDLYVRALESTITALEKEAGIADERQKRK